MNHGERIKIATALSKMIVEKYRDDIVYMGVYGSTAKGTDRPDSDIDMLVITKTMSSFNAHHIRDVTVWVEFVNKQQADNQLLRVGESWPYDIGQLMYGMTLYDPNNFLEYAKEKVSKLDKQLFIKPAEAHLNEAEAIMRKLVHSSEEKDIAATRYWVPLFIEHTNLMVALINKAWFTYGGNKTMLNVHEFHEAPKSYVDDCRALLVINDCSAVGSIAQDIWENCRRFADQHGVKPKRYKNTEEIGI